MAQKQLASVSASHAPLCRDQRAEGQRHIDEEVEEMEMALENVEEA